MCSKYSRWSILYTSRVVCGDNVNDIIYNKQIALKITGIEMEITMRGRGSCQNVDIVHWLHSCVCV